MKLQEGIVEKYDGYTGRIVSEGKKYVLTDNNIVSGNDIKVNDKVSFVSENVMGVDMARFVKLKEEQ